jgi:hypothetical protein
MCQRKTRQVVTRMGFFGSRSVIRDTTTIRQQSVSECKNLITQYRENRLRDIGHHIATTAGQFTETFSWCCVDNPQEVTYSNVHQGELFLSYENNRLMTTLPFVTDRCAYADGQCEADGLVLIWQPQPQDECPYVGEDQTVHGQTETTTDDKTHIRLLADEEQIIAFDWKEVTVCAGKLTLNVSTDGLYFQLWHSDSKNHTTERTLQDILLTERGRTKQRGTDSTHQVLYIIDRMRENTAKSFRSAWAQICRTRQRQFDLFREFSYENPTFAFRALLGRHDITAQAAGDIFYIWTCNNVSNYTMTPFETKCYRDIPITLADSSKAFVKTGTREIVTDSVTTPCEHARHQLFHINNAYFTYYRATWTRATHEPFRIVWSVSPLALRPEDVLNASYTYHDGSSLAAITQLSQIVVHSEALHSAFQSLITQAGLNGQALHAGAVAVGERIRAATSWFARVLQQPLVVVLTITVIAIGILLIGKVVVRQLRPRSRSLRDEHHQDPPAPIGQDNTHTASNVIRHMLSPDQ